jgi:hypothetical protein
LIELEACSKNLSCEILPLEIQLQVGHLPALQFDLDIHDWGTKNGIIEYIVGLTEKEGVFGFNE